MIFFLFYVIGFCVFFLEWMLLALRILGFSGPTMDPISSAESRAVLAMKYEIVYWFGLVSLSTQSPSSLHLVTGFLKCNLLHPHESRTNFHIIDVYIKDECVALSRGAIHGIGDPFTLLFVFFLYSHQVEMVRQFNHCAPVALFSNVSSPSPYGGGRSR